MLDVCFVHNVHPDPKKIAAGGVVKYYQIDESQKVIFLKKI